MCRKSKYNKVFRRGILKLKLTDLYSTDSRIDFNDIDVLTDNQLFIDPFKIKRSNTDLSKKCLEKLTDFFSTATKFVKEGKNLDKLFDKLNECNETCLGWSKGCPHGKGVSGKLGHQLSFALMNHPLIENNVIQNVEDFSVFLENFGSDRVSDICTRVILLELAEFTEDWCKKLCIPNALSLKEKHYWNNITHTWDKARFKLPTVANRDIIFTPVYLTSKYLILKDFIDFVNLGILEYYKEFYQEEGLISLERISRKKEKMEPYKKDITNFFQNEGIDIYDKEFFYKLDTDKQMKMLEIYKKSRNHKLESQKT